MTGFTPAQVRRYSRHVLLPDIGGVGQARLLAAAVVIDAGGAAARIAAAYLAAAGVGRIWLDGDLARPVDGAAARFPLAAGDRGRPLGEALARALAGHNPDVAIAVGAAPAGAHRLRLDGDADDRPLADAFAHGGAAAAALAHAIATGGAR
ncbi:MAG TPA: hypothetical protein VM734_14330 [Kofleriaceae bacterium]|jgi:adenylyltransferase/sulfurtransferase|nr:hypothetical protein [Kofleriaceae bacterium]